MPPEFQPVTQLATPASDITFPAFQNFEAIFGRSGNDTIYSDAPDGIITQNENVDFLFGDVFDNTVDEYVTVVFGIQAGDPLGVLDRTQEQLQIGADRFVLGDGYTPYYLNSGSPNDLLSSTNFLGLNEYAVIFDFDTLPGDKQDTIQLNGSREDYLLVEVNGLQVPGVQRPFFGEALFSLEQGIPDLISYVVTKENVDLDLSGNYFDFVVDKPQKTSPLNQKLGQFGTTGVDVSSGVDIDPSGNVYLTGFTNGPLQGANQGLFDVWVGKYNSSGNQLFGKQFGTSTSDQALAITTDNAGNFYLSGNTAGNLFGTKQTPGDEAWVAKYDSNGNQVWARQFANQVSVGDATASFGIDVDPAGNVYVSGLTIKPNTRPDVNNFPAQDDSWVTKFDSNGNQQWFTEFAGLAFDESYDIAVDKNGNSYLVGWTQGLVKESDPSRETRKYDAWVGKVNTTGQIEWIQQLGSTNEGVEFAWGVDTDSKGDVYVTGWTTGQLGTEDAKSRSGNYDIWLAKLRPDGNQVWTKQFGSKGTTGDDGTYISDLEIDANDNVFLLGYTNDKLAGGPADPNYNAWVAKFDTNGQNKWTQQFGSKSRLDYPTGLAVDNTGKLFVSGITDGLLGSTGDNTGAVDAWLAQLDVEKGNLQKFVGDSTDLISSTPSAISTVNANIVADDLLPNGDNIIKPGGGPVISYGQIVNTLTGVFDPNGQDTFATVFAQGVTNNSAPFLSATDLDLLTP